MPMTDEHGRPCGFLEIDESDKRKKFQRRYFIVDLNCRLIKWFKENPAVSIKYIIITINLSMKAFLKGYWWIKMYRKAGWNRKYINDITGIPTVQDRKGGDIW